MERIVSVLVPKPRKVETFPDIILKLKKKDTLRMFGDGQNPRNHIIKHLSLIRFRLRMVGQLFVKHSLKMYKR